MELGGFLSNKQSLAFKGTTNHKVRVEVNPYPYKLSLNQKPETVLPNSSTENSIRPTFAPRFKLLESFELFKSYIW